MDAHGKIRTTYLIQMAGTCATAKAEKMIWRSRDIAIKPWMPFPSIVHCSRMLFNNMLYRSISWKSTVCKAEGSKAFDFITSARSKGSGTCVIILCTRIYLQKKNLFIFQVNNSLSVKWQKGGPKSSVFRDIFSRYVVCYFSYVLELSSTSSWLLVRSWLFCLQNRPCLVSFRCMFGGRVEALTKKHSISVH